MIQRSVLDLGRRTACIHPMPQPSFSAQPALDLFPFRFLHGRAHAVRRVPIPKIRFRPSSPARDGALWSLLVLHAGGTLPTCSTKT